MSQRSLARRRDRRIIRRFGDGRTATLRQNSTVLSGLYLHGAATSGATSVECVSDDGAVVRGSVVSIAGVSGSYAVQQTAQAANGRINLSFAPPLAGNAQDGASLTFSQAFGEWPYPVMDGPGTAEVDKGVEGGRQVRVLAYQASKPAPRESGDLLDGLPITSVDPVGNPPSRYRVTVTPP